MKVVNRRNLGTLLFSQLALFEKMVQEIRWRVVDLRNVVKSVRGLSQSYIERMQQIKRSHTVEKERCQVCFREQQP